MSRDELDRLVTAVDAGRDEYQRRAIQEQFAVVEAVSDDWRPTRVESREAIRLAVLKAAEDRHGLVHITGIRRHLPPWVTPAQIGPAINRLVRRGFLVNVGKYEPNADPSIHARNGAKPAPVRRLTKYIPPDAVQADRSERNAS